MVVEENPELIVCIINKNEYCIIKDKRPETSGPWRLGTKTRFLQLYISFFIKEVFLIFFIIKDKSVGITVHFFTQA